MAKDSLKRLLGDELISEEEYDKGIHFLADRFGVDPSTGFYWTVTPRTSKKDLLMNAISPMRI